MTAPSSLLTVSIVIGLAVGAVHAPADVIYAEDFDDSNGQFTAVGARTSWSWGSPSSGPASAHSGGQLWATNLAGPYGPNEDSLLRSEVIDLNDHAGGGLLLSWWEYNDVESGFDGFSVEVTADGGASWERVDGERSGQFLHWQRREVYLAERYASPLFRLQFRLRSDATVSRFGCYVDTIRIRALAEERLHAFDFETGDQGFAQEPGGVWEFGTPASGPGSAHSGDHAWATDLSSDYPPNTISFLQSAPLDITAATGRNLLVAWWQYVSTEQFADIFQVEVSIDGERFHPIYGPVSGLLGEGWQPKHATISLRDQVDVQTIILRFRFASDPSIAYPGVFLDDIRLSALGAPSTMLVDYETWLSRHFSSETLSDPELEAGVWGENADGDLDGIPVLMEYFMNLDPRVEDARDAFTLIQEGDRWQIRYRRSLEAHGIRSHLAVSEDLQAWTEIRPFRAVFDATSETHEVLQVEIEEDMRFPVRSFFRIDVSRESP